MGISSWQENYGGDCYTIACLVWSSESTNLPAHAWLTWCDHGYFVEVGSKLGSFRPFVRVCKVRALGAMGYVLVSSFLIRENILALITINIHASLTYIMTAVGINTIPSMDVIYAIFGTLLMLNCGFFALLLHILYGVFFARLGMKASLTLPRWLEKAI
ncbi:uncharacterized protein LOC130768432 isoform X2 [Actinidia eriantha]|uniref:uncharacterized protein LOC130768432 isoform X2 n=1 Tax=Actinidia eriantha TaxID=165200 RepID=UPI0025849E6F|nr:uncharacterized protein LOC130768432 isoform X2 [Actinidia eriantha]